MSKPTFIAVCSWLLLALAGCSSTNSGPADVALSPPDESLNMTEYLALGVPPPDRAWSADDYEETVKTLTKLMKKGPHVLPRLNSSRSGPIFDRIISKENFASDAKAFDPTRQEKIARLSICMRPLMHLYIEALQSQKVGGIEVIHLIGTSGRLTLENIRGVNRLLATLDKNDPTYAVRMDLFSTMQGQIVPLVAAGLDPLADESINIADRQKLLEYHQECFPEIVAFLTPEVQTDAMKRLDELCADAKLSELHPQLLKLREAVKAAIASAKTE